MDNLDYELRDDGVLYALGGGITAKVQGKSAQRTRVTLQKEEKIVPPEAGMLASSKFRDRLTRKAQAQFGEVNGFADELGAVAAMFDEHLKEREEAASENEDATNIPEFVRTPYRIEEGGGFSRIRHTGGAEVPQTLTNFIARVDEEVVQDDGMERKRSYKISGCIGGRNLSTINVSVGEFNSMKWVSEYWGLEAHITAGQEQYAKEAIELYSREAIESYSYCHTGWRVLGDGTRVYLHAGGAIHDE